MNTANQSRQPTPGERHRFNRAPVARRGCAGRLGLCAMTLLLGNIAVPVVFPQSLLALAVLLPIVAVEGLELRRQLPIPYARLFEANLLSTIVGNPFAILWIGFCNWIFNRETAGWATADLMSRASLTDPDALWVLGFLVLGVLLPS